jgi:geranylgeranyl pyrophosphate synthase
MSTEDIAEIAGFIKKRAELVDLQLKEYLKTNASDKYISTLIGKSSYRYDSAAIDKALLDPAWYLMNLGGKRLRPVLMLLVIEALGKNPDDFVEFSIIPEIIHNGTLVHDDIEDSSTMRRGAQSVHVKYGLDVALNLGDFLFYFPVVALLESKKLNARTKNAIFSIYTRDMLRLGIGQATELAWHNQLVDPSQVTEDNYLQMAFDKTGALTGMAARMGAVLAGANKSTVNALGRFGATIGVAFQLQDDLLNLKESMVSKNKGGIGEDIREGKITLAVIYTLKNANEEDKRALSEILRPHTASIDGINRAVEIMQRYGAENYMDKVKDRLINDAWKDLDKYVPESGAKKKLKGMLEFLITRMG